MVALAAAYEEQEKERKLVVGLVVVLVVAEGMMKRREWNEDDEDLAAAVASDDLSCRPAAVDMMVVAVVAVANEAGRSIVQIRNRANVNLFQSTIIFDPPPSSLLPAIHDDYAHLILAQIIFQ